MKSTTTTPSMAIVIATLNHIEGGFGTNSVAEIQGALEAAGYLPDHYEQVLVEAANYRHASDGGDYAVWVEYRPVEGGYMGRKCTSCILVPNEDEVFVTDKSAQARPIFSIKWWELWYEHKFGVRPRTC